MQNRSPAVELKALVKKYKDVVAVDHLTLSISRGEFLTLLGPSGSGKTTTLLMIAGFEKLTDGEIILEGRSVALAPPHKRNIGMVFQNYALFPHMNVADNIAFPLKMRKVSTTDIKRRTADVLNQVRLPGYEKRYPHQLSGGQQQRVAVARALVFQPSLLLMDEPLGSLDRKLREEMQVELRKIHIDLEITSLYVTHDQEEALALSDRIALLNEGKLQQVDSPGEVYERPANKFVAGFLGEATFFTGHVLAFEKGNPILSIGEESCICVSKPASCVLNDEVTVAVRPEKMRLAQSNPEDENWNSVPGVVKSVVYLGDTTKYHIRFGNEQTALVEELNSGRLRGRKYEPGEPVRVCWRFEDSVVVQQ